MFTFQEVWVHQMETNKTFLFLFDVYVRLTKCILFYVCVLGMVAFLLFWTDRCG